MRGAFRHTNVTERCLAGDWEGRFDSKYGIVTVVSNGEGRYLARGIRTSYETYPESKGTSRVGR
jgi:hypothetical protein